MKGQGPHGHASASGERQRIGRVRFLHWASRRCWQSLGRSLALGCGLRGRAADGSDNGPCFRLSRHVLEGNLLGLRDYQLRLAKDL